MQAMGAMIAEDFANHAVWKPTHTGAQTALLRMRSCALLARSTTAAASIYYYWYVPS
jgi:hypothetical protein